MSAPSASRTPKEKTEQTVVNLLRADSVLNALLPRKQNSDEKKQSPVINVVATPGKEYPFSSGLHRIPCSVDFSFTGTQPGQESADLEDAVARGWSVLRAAQARGVCGIILEGESEQMQGYVRKRSIRCTFIGG